MERLRAAAEMLLDVLLPRTAREERVARASAAALAARVHRARPHPAAQLALLPYREPPVRDAICVLKYRGSGRAATLLAEALAPHLAELLAEARLWGGDAALLVPMPLSRERLRERGYNQCLLLARALVRERAELCELAEDALVRVRHGESQTRMRGRAAREENLRGAFSVRAPARIAGRDVVLLDDVVTTGATMREARRTLEDAGARRVICIALAH